LRHSDLCVTTPSLHHREIIIGRRHCHIPAIDLLLNEEALQSTTRSFFCHLDPSDFDLVVPVSVGRTRTPSGRSAPMTDHSLVLLPPFHAEPHEPAQTPLPALSISNEAGAATRIEQPRRSAHWLAASGRWMNRGFDPAKAEAIRESYRSVSGAGEDDGA
jgi:hypothetical protein